MQLIRGLPINDTPDMFGLHENANITFAMNETSALLNGILLLQPKSSAGGGQSREEVIHFTSFIVLNFIQFTMHTSSTYIMSRVAHYA